MKDKLLVIGFLLLMNLGYTQTLLEENKTWNVVTCMNFGGCSTQILKISGDTTIDQVIYKKLYFTNDSIDNNWHILYGIRENTETNLVYIYDFMKGEEKLLYDFSLQEGDIFQTPLCPDFEMVLGEIDTVTLENGEQRRRYSFGYSEQWIVGIGSLNGLVSVGYNYCMMDIWKELSCCHESDELIYMSPEYSDCYVNTLGIEDGMKKELVKVFPNPTNGMIKLQFNDLVFSDMTIEVVNMSGQLVFSNVFSSYNNESIDLNYLSKGIYSIIIKSDNQIYRDKLLIE